jgi:hypothetical protein
MVFDPSITIWVALGGTIGYFLFSRCTRSQLPLPLGSKGLLRIGNTLDIPSRCPWEKYMAWSEQSGEWYQYVLLV